MELAPAGDVELCFERLGQPGRPTVLLVAGHGAQLGWWDDELCARLVAEDFSVVRYDNRDVGASTSFESSPRPDIRAALRGETTPVPYTLWDMAEDAACLLDSLGIADAHVVGVSMGAMIAQSLAVAHPDRVRSLCSIMASTGAPGAGAMPRRTIDAFVELSRAYPDPVQREVETCRRMASPGFAFDEARARRRTERHVARGAPAGGVERQLAAILVSGDRTGALHSLSVPTLVIHGDADATIPPDGGRATAAAIPGAALMTIAGMAHELPPETWSDVVAAIVALARRADAGRARWPGPAGERRGGRG